METERKDKKRRVLVVDDEQENLESCRDLLAQEGYAVELCRDSTQVIPLLKAQAFDAVVLDIRMPGIEGGDLLPLIKKVHSQLPVIIASAYCDETNRKHYHSLGAFEAIAKPFSRETFLDAVSRAVRQEEEIPIVLTKFSLLEARDQVYRKLILNALRRTDWNQVRAAELLGVSRYCLMRWIRKLSISY
ncbi:MAG: response regulator [Candidatus Omnitrophica bacterium]|nr:response regulator [Candidatus Omnitrophota bacterium]